MSDVIEQAVKARFKQYKKIRNPIDCFNAMYGLLSAKGLSTGSKLRSKISNKVSGIVFGCIKSAPNFEAAIVWLDIKREYTIKWQPSSDGFNFEMEVIDKVLRMTRTASEDKALLGYITQARRAHLKARIIEREAKERVHLKIKLVREIAMTGDFGGLYEIACEADTNKMSDVVAGVYEKALVVAKVFGDYKEILKWICLKTSSAHKKLLHSKLFELAATVDDCLWAYENLPARYAKKKQLLERALLCANAEQLRQMLRLCRDDVTFSTKIARRIVQNSWDPLRSKETSLQFFIDSVGHPIEGRVATDAVRDAVQEFILMQSGTLEVAIDDINKWIVFCSEFKTFKTDEFLLPLRKKRQMLTMQWLAVRGHEGPFLGFVKNGYVFEPIFIMQVYWLALRIADAYSQVSSILTDERVDESMRDEAVNVCRKLALARCDRDSLWELAQLDYLTDEKRETMYKAYNRYNKITL